jgi:hypothetical protein
MLAERQPSFKQCVIADSSSDLAPIMIGDKRYTEALEDEWFRPFGLVGERCSDIEAEAEATVEFLQVRMQT